MIVDGELANHVGASLMRIIIGYANGCVWAIILGSAAGRIAAARGLIMPVMNLVRPISPVALVPLMIIWFGIGEMSKVVLVGYTAFITIFFNTMTGVASVPPTRIRAAQTLGASGFSVFRLVVFPSAIPYILAGMRIGLGLAFMSVVAAELIAAEEGIGFLIIQSRYSMLVDRMFVGLLCLSVIGFSIDYLFRRLIRRFGGAYVGKEFSETL
ncbi:ABC transporter permease [Georgenia yuyongxinii]|nr:ABC transporter permease [Georgenia yuyongxinii]